ncbi:hypothetical protein [Streptomyces sp. NPDC053367]|uniref:hypothetical protein n=1 Tax=Streptomyces sp. NPDC053367 TaxID=3365700 RepID=UPI0037D88524
MRLADLRAALANLGHLPDDTIVVLAKDAEGNGFSPLAEAEDAMYWAETTWSGERYLTEEQRRAEANPDDWSEAPDDAVRAVFLWPVN